MIVPESQDPHPQHIDLVGVALSVVGLVALVYGIIKGGENNQWGSCRRARPAHRRRRPARGVRLPRAPQRPPVARRQRCSRTPRSPRRRAAISLVFFGLFGATFFLTFYLQFDRGYSTAAGRHPAAAGRRRDPGLRAAQLGKVAKRFGNKATVAGGMTLSLVAYLGYQLLDTHTTHLGARGMLLVQGIGMANVMAPATESIMTALPRERAGAGSAVNNTMRQVGGALGVAILGSMLSSAFRGKIDPTLDAGPPARRRARGAAGQSIGGLYQVRRQGQGRRPGRSGSRASARSSTRCTSTSLGSALVVLVGIVVVLVWLPGKDSGDRSRPTRSARPRSRSTYDVTRSHTAGRGTRPRPASRPARRGRDRRGDARAARRARATRG